MMRVFWKLSDAGYIEQVPGRNGSNYEWQKKLEAPEYQPHSQLTNQMSLFDLLENKNATNER